MKLRSFEMTLREVTSSSDFEKEIRKPVLTVVKYYADWVSMKGVIFMNKTKLFMTLSNLFYLFYHVKLETVRPM